LSYDSDGVLRLVLAKNALPEICIFMMFLGSVNEQIKHNKGYRTFNRKQTLEALHITFILQKIYTVVNDYKG
jgi:hypothetical protein